jgi:putative hydrolase of the HAD superfamily
MSNELAHIETWICDLDNTLYPARCNLFELIDQRMGAYIGQRFDVGPDEAWRIQKRYFASHGTTLAGLMADHAVDPHEFLEFVHDIPTDRLAPDPRLKAALNALPGRKLVFTNGDAPYAARVLAALDLDSCFEAVFDIHDCAYRPKPAPEAYAAFCAAHDIDPTRAIFLEDMARNLKPAKAIGMTTVWIDNGSDQSNGAASESFIDYQTDCASAWLHGVAGELTA